MTHSDACFNPKTALVTMVCILHGKRDVCHYITAHMDTKTFTKTFIFEEDQLNSIQCGIIDLLNSLKMLSCRNKTVQQDVA